MKAQSVLKATTAQTMTPAQFEELCKATEFDVNSLGNISRLRVPVRCKKEFNVSKLARTVLGLMFVLCYDF